MAEDELAKRRSDKIRREALGNPFKEVARRKAIIAEMLKDKGKS